MLPVDEEVVSLQDAVKSTRKIKNGSNNKRFIVISLDIIVRRLRIPTFLVAKRKIRYLSSTTYHYAT